MYRIDGATALSSLPTPAAAGTPGYFGIGSPGPTVVSADWLNMVQEEMLAVIVAAGETPSKTTFTQLRDAIETLIASVAATAATAAQIQAGTVSGAFATPAGLAGASAPQTLADAATTGWDMSAGFNAKWTLGGNRTLAAPTNSILGRTYMLAVKQPTSGGPYTVTWPSAFDWGGAGAPALSTTASARDAISLYCETAGSTPKFIASFWSGT
ncbi:MAG: hypothetical protein P4L73_19315 [Caulobacteraceae bacterium]|nr:hypothetical protein [Caulobacteraceae bacterium]